MIIVIIIIGGIMKIKWKDTLNLNIDVIDKQHKMFFVMLSVLEEAIIDGKAKQIQSELIDKLIGYAADHFSREEKYLAEYNYPEIELHKKEHSVFVDSLLKFKLECEKGKLTLSIDMIDFMSSWWVNHINLIDKKYLPYVKELVR